MNALIYLILLTVCFPTAKSQAGHRRELNGMMMTPAPTPAREQPTSKPTAKKYPTNEPTMKKYPTKEPTAGTKAPTVRSEPTSLPTRKPTKPPTEPPAPVKEPTEPTQSPVPVLQPTEKEMNPTRRPTKRPTNAAPTRRPTKKRRPTARPTKAPTAEPTTTSTYTPSASPTKIRTVDVGGLPKLQGARFTDSGLIQLMFDQATDRGVVRYGRKKSFYCKSWFQASSGVGIIPVCRFSSSKILLIYTGKDASISAGDSLVLQPGHVRSINARVKSDPSTSGAIGLASPANGVQPQPRLVVPQKVKLGDLLTVDATASVGSGGRSFARVDWSHTLPNGSTKKLSSGSLVFNRMMTEEGKHTFTLGLTNHFGKTHSVSRDVVAVETAEPALVVLGGTNQTFLALVGTVSFLLEARLDFMTSTYSAEEWKHRIHWDNLDNAPLLNNRVESSLVLDAQTLVVGRAYRFGVSSGTVVENITVHVKGGLQSPLIIGAMTRKVSPTEEVLIEAADKANEGVWSCEFQKTKQGDIEPCDAALLVRIGRVYRIAPNTLRLGLYTLRLTVEELTADPVLLFVEEQNTDQVVGFVGVVPTKVNKDQVFRLEGFTTGNKTNCSFSEVENTLIDFSASRASQEGSLSLVLRAFTFVESSSYTFTLECGGGYAATSSIRVNIAPHGGRLSVTLNEGLYDIAALEWDDEVEDLPLRYSFRYYQAPRANDTIVASSETGLDPVSLLTGDAVLNIPDNTEEIILQPKGFVSRFSTLLPTSNGTLVVAVRVFDQLGAFGEAAQRVVVEEGTQIASRHETLRDMLMNPVCDLGLLEALQISNGEHLTQALQVLERILLKCRDEVNATNTFVGFVRSLNVNRTLKVYDRELAFGKVFLTNSIAYWMGRVLAAKQFDSSLNMYFGHHISRGQVSRTVPEEIGARLTVDKLFSLTTARSQFDRGVRRRFENFELEQAGGDVLDARVLEWAENPHGGNQTLSSRVMEFTLSDPDTGSVRMFNNKESPLLFEAIQRVPIHENDTIECGFFNVTTRKWSTNGCWLFKEDDVAVVCACNHTTDFVTWVKTRDTLVDVIRGDGFGNSLADSWYVIVVLFFILSICSGLILAGILLDSRDGANYRRAVLLFLFFERQQKRVAFDRLKTALKQHSLNRNAPSTETSGYRNTSYTDRGAWYHLKLRSRFLSYFFQYDAVFNRLHRAMIMSCVILGKLFTSALFFHFTSKPLYDIVDRLLIVLINTIVFGAFVVCATFVLLRVPPVCGRQRKFNADLKRKCKNQRVIDFQSNPCEPTLLVVESTKEQHEAKTVHQHRTKIDQLLYLFADKPEGKITLWPGWTWYVAYTILGMWCIFCCYFILSWGFVSGNAVVVDWLPTMMLSLFLSLFVFDPMLHLSRRWATRQYQERNPVPRVDNGCYYFEKIEQKNRCDKTVSFIIED